MRNPEAPKHHSNTEAQQCAGCLGAAQQRAEGGAQAKPKHHPKAKK